MKREEIEQAIENGESVWYLSDVFEEPVEIKMREHTDRFVNRLNFYCYTDKNGEKREHHIENLYKTKAEAEHYLHHANISRTEKLPFLTWEGFNKGITLCFIGYDRHAYRMFKKKLYGERIEDCLGEFIVLENDTAFPAKYYDLTEANFYKAYDECVRLFKGEQNV